MPEGGAQRADEFMACPHEKPYALDLRHGTQQFTADTAGLAVTARVRRSVRSRLVHGVHNDHQRGPLAATPGEFLKQRRRAIRLGAKSGADPLHHLFEPLVPRVYGGRHAPFGHDRRRIDTGEVEPRPVAAVRQSDNPAEDGRFPAARTPGDDTASPVAVLRRQPVDQFGEHSDPSTEVQALLRLEFHTARAWSEVLGEIPLGDPALDFEIGADRR